MTINAIKFLRKAAVLEKSLSENENQFMVCTERGLQSDGLSYFGMLSMFTQGTGTNSLEFELEPIFIEFPQKMIGEIVNYSRNNQAVEAHVLKGYKCSCISSETCLRLVCKAHLSYSSYLASITNIEFSDTLFLKHQSYPNFCRIKLKFHMLSENMFKLSVVKFHVASQP